MLQAYIDVIHGGSARVLIGDEEVAVDIPLHLLPPHAQAGMVLRAKFTIDYGATASRGGGRKSGATEE